MKLANQQSLQHGYLIAFNFVCVDAAVSIFSFLGKLLNSKQFLIPTLQAHSQMSNNFAFPDTAQVCNKYLMQHRSFHIVSLYLPLFAHAQCKVVCCLSGSGDNSLSEQLTSNAQARALRLELENRRLAQTLENLQETSFQQTNETILELEKEKKRLSLVVSKASVNYLTNLKIGFNSFQFLNI